MLATGEMIREKYGGAERYLEAECGFGKEKFEEIRANVVDKTKFTTVDPKEYLSVQQLC